MSSTNISGVNQISEASAGFTQWTSQEPEAVRWYALHTQARHERTVERRLRDEGITAVHG